MRTDSFEDLKIRHLLGSVVKTSDFRAFVDVYVAPPLRPKHWCWDARRSLRVENAGGNSEDSECVSIQYMVDRFAAKDVLLEMEVKYIFSYKMVDYIAVIQNKRVGISVTRAMPFPLGGHYSDEQALALLQKKLVGLIIAREGVSEEQSFTTCILHILVPSVDVAYTVQRAHTRMLSEEDSRVDLDYEERIRDVIVLITVSKEIPSVFLSTKALLSTSLVGLNKSLY